MFLPQPLCCQGDLAAHGTFPVALLSKGPSRVIAPAAAAPCALAQPTGTWRAASHLQPQVHPRELPTLRATQAPPSSPLAVFTGWHFPATLQNPQCLSLKPPGCTVRVRCYPWKAAKALQSSAQNITKKKIRKLACYYQLYAPKNSCNLIKWKSV